MYPNTYTKKLEQYNKFLQKEVDRLNKELSKYKQRTFEYDRSDTKYRPEEEIGVSF